MLKISVIIPVYNASAFLAKAVESALQFGEIMEILLVEDGSTDHSLEVCEKLCKQNEKIFLFQHPDHGNHGAGASRNLGLKMASQEFIAFLDADDYYLPNRFDAEEEIFKNNRIEGVFGAIGTEFLTKKGKQEFEEKFKNIKLITVNFPAEGMQVFEGLLGLTEETFGTFFHLNTLTVRKSSISKHQLKFNENLRVHQDSDFIIRLAFCTYLKSGIIGKAIAIRGVHDDNRITKIVRYSKNYNGRQFLLWQSLYEWSRFEKINLRAKNEIYLNYSAFKLSLNEKPTRFFTTILEILKNPRILKSRYRFTYLNR